MPLCTSEKERVWGAAWCRTVVVVLYSTHTQSIAISSPDSMTRYPGAGEVCLMRRGKKAPMFHQRAPGRWTGCDPTSVAVLKIVYHLKEPSREILVQQRYRMRSAVLLLSPRSSHSQCCCCLLTLHRITRWSAPGPAGALAATTLSPLCNNSAAMTATFSISSTSCTLVSAIPAFSSADRIEPNSLEVR